MSEEALRTLGLENDDLDILAVYRTDQQAALRRWGAKWEAWWNAARPQDGQPWMPSTTTRRGRTAPPALGAWALWNGTNPDGFIGQMWMRTTVTLTAEQAAKAGAVLDLGSVNQEDETWVNGKYVGASSFANRTQYPIESGVLKAGVNVIATNIYCGWRDCGIRGPAENRAIRFADGTSVPLSNPWKYQEVPDRLIGPAAALGAGPRHDAGLQRDDLADRRVWLSWRGLVPGRIRRALPARNYKATLLGMMADWRRQFENPEPAVSHRPVAGLRTDPGAAHILSLGRCFVKRSVKPQLRTSMRRSP